MPKVTRIGQTGAARVISGVVRVGGPCDDRLLEPVSSHNSQARSPVVVSGYSPVAKEAAGGINVPVFSAGQWRAERLRSGRDRRRMRSAVLPAVAVPLLIIQANPNAYGAGSAAQR